MITTRARAQTRRRGDGLDGTMEGQWRWVSATMHAAGVTTESRGAGQLYRGGAGLDGTMEGPWRLVSVTMHTAGGTTQRRGDGLDGTMDTNLSDHAHHGGNNSKAGGWPTLRRGIGREEG